MLDIEDKVRTVGDIFPEIEPAQMIKDDICCPKSDQNKNCDEVTEKK